MKNLGARSSVIVGLGAVALMLTSIACGSSSSTTGTGGSGAGGGSTGTGGTSSAGGAGGAGTKPTLLSYTFDTAGSTEGFAIQNFVDPSNLGSLAADAGVPDGGTYPTLMQMDGVGQGSPASGALAVTADFTGYNKYVELRLGLSPAKDLSGSSLHAAVEVTKAFVGGAFIYAKSGQTYVYSNSTGTPLTAGAFTALTMNMDTAVGANGGTFDPTMIQEIGVHIYSDSPIDGGTFADGPYTFYIDNIIAK